jgi:hypothetical protein
VIYNAVHMYLAQRVAVGGFEGWHEAIDKVELLKHQVVVAAEDST